MSKASKYTLHDIYWEDNFRGLMNYVLQHKKWPCCKANPKFHGWIRRQRQYYRQMSDDEEKQNKKFSSERLNRLQSIEFPFTSSFTLVEPNLELCTQALQQLDNKANDTPKDYEANQMTATKVLVATRTTNDSTSWSSWDDYFNHLVSHIKQYKAWPTYQTNHKLYQWMRYQRLAYRGDIQSFSDETLQRYSMLEYIGFPFGTGTSVVSGDIVFSGKPNLSSSLFVSATITTTTTTTTTNKPPSWSTWEDYFDNLVDHIKQYRAWPTYQTNRKLQHWLENQRLAYRGAIQSFSAQKLKQYNMLKDIGFRFDGAGSGRGRGVVFGGIPKLPSPLLASTSTTTDSVENAASTQHPTVVLPPARPSPDRNLLPASSFPRARHYSTISQQQQKQQQNTTNGKRKRSLTREKSSPSRQCTAQAAAAETDDDCSNTNKKQCTHPVTPLQHQQHPPSQPMPLSDPVTKWWDVTTNNNNNNVPRKNAARLLHHCMRRY